MNSKPAPGRKETREARKTAFPLLVYATRVPFGQKVSCHWQAVPQRTSNGWIGKQSHLGHSALLGWGGSQTSVLSLNSVSCPPFSLSPSKLGSVVWFHQLWNAGIKHNPALVWWNDQRTKVGKERNLLRSTVFTVSIATSGLSQICPNSEGSRLWLEQGMCQFLPITGGVSDPLRI